MAQVATESALADLVCVPCPQCGSEGRTKLYAGTISAGKIHAWKGYSYDIFLDGHHPIVRCTNCGLVYAWPRDSSEVLARMYARGTVVSYLRETEGKLASFRREAKFLNQLCGGGDLLEIGCAAGLFLRAAAETGFQVWGCDPWIEAAELAQREFGDHVRIGNFDAGAYPPESFHAVALWDVIEHLEDPVRQVREIYRLLSPGGWLALSTPNFASRSRMFLGPRWHFLERPHLVLFEPATISRLLHAAGFNRIRIRPQWKTYSVLYFASYLAKWSGLLARGSGAVLRVAFPARAPMLRLPSGCMCVYACRAR